MEFEDLKDRLLALPEAAAWPALADLWARTSTHAGVDWQLVPVACQAVCGDPAPALDAAVALRCLQLSIILVDDILDEDPRGLYRHLGEGRAANLALALQAAAFRLLGASPAPAEGRLRALQAMAWAALETARGQDLDVQDAADEAGYWQVVRTKSLPFYGAALEMGAWLGGADPETAQSLREIGLLVGEVVQLHDDLFDAFEKPARPDWARHGTNLLILYARTADHSERDRFQELAGRATDPEALEAAQRILLRCGAVSYCAYHLIRRHREIARRLEALPLKDPSGLTAFLARQAEPVASLLEKAGAEGAGGVAL